MGARSEEASNRTTETAISRQQSQILAQREAQYQQYFFPELLKGIANSSQTAKTNYAAATKNINSSYASNRQTFAQSMAKRGLVGSGVEAQGLASMANARAGDLATAYNNAQQTATDNRLKYLTLAMGMSPTPVKEVGYGQQQSSSGWSVQV